MTDRNPSRELEELLKKQSRSAKEWAYSISGAFWQNKGQVVDDEYLFVCLANAMMSMHDSIFNKEIKNLEEEIAKLKCVNDKYLDIIQAKNMNESFLESEIVSLKQQLEKTNEMIGHVVYDYERLISSKVDKIETLEQELQKTRDQLVKAEKVIQFYSEGYVVDQADWDDDDDADCVNTWNLYTGKRARQYLRDKQGE